MSRTAKKISNLVIDEISLVDKGANQHAVVTIAKNADGENKENEMHIFDEQGNQLDVADLDEGDVVYDEEGNAYEMAYEEEKDEQEQEREPAAVGKSSVFGVQEPARTDFATSVREELSKALTDADREEVITKALGRVDEMAQEMEIAKSVAEQERTMRIQREYTEIAKSYNLPFEDEELGGVLMRCAERLPVEDCEVIHKAFEAAGAAIFEEYGAIGGGGQTDIYDEVEAAIDDQVSKSGVSREEAISDFFMHNPEAYDEYLTR